MNMLTKKITYLLSILFTSLLLSACDSHDHGSHSSHDGHSAHGEMAEPEVEKGPHNGRLLKDGDFVLELAIFETGVPPEFRVWTTKAGKPLSPEEVQVKVNLTRLGNKVDRINFAPQGDALRGDMEIYEPHSFVVSVSATHAGKTYQWQYDNFEGRTRIEDAVADALEIKTEVAGPVVIPKTIEVFGKISPNAERMRKVSARFDGLIKTVSVSIGDTVREGQKLATVESNESLKLYTIRSPISGVVTQRDANPGEQTNGRQLFMIVDPASVWAELAVFPGDIGKVKVGAPVTVSNTTDGYQAKGEISRINVVAEANQAVMVRAVLDNPEGRLMPGNFVSATIKVGEHPAELAVRRSGLQAFRDFTVVYAKIGEEYEVRMLELGLQSGEWAEVLGGLEPGTTYVSENSYVIKADIEKSGASHDH